MISSLYSSATAMKAFSTGMGVIGNNLANTSTVGFKQQNLQYADLMYDTQGNMGAYNNNEEGSFTSMGQVGLGVQVDSIRTLFHEGGFELTNANTDLAIGGKGFFQVVDEDGGLFYTKAGNFNFDNEGILRNPAGLSLSGYGYDENGVVGNALGPIEVDHLRTMAPRETTNTTFIVNVGLGNNESHDADNPYFSMANNWNSNDTDNGPLTTNEYGYSSGMKSYDENGKSQDLNVYFDAATNDGQLSIVEFVVGTNPSNPPTDSKDGLLMMGTLTFDAGGKLVNKSAFVPTGADKSDLKSWTPAALSEGGLPQYTLNGKAVTLDFGINSQTGWTNIADTAADVGTDSTKLGNFDPAPSTRQATTGFGNTSFSSVSEQDGYAMGYMNSMHINDQGEMIFSYTNSQSETLYQIPIARFVSEDGLWREGGNLFSAPDAAGNMEMGTGGTENYGKVLSHTLETSNVDMSKEMVNMIITQRSFQSCSKAIMTSDSMLQKAIELKR